jgi:tetratricopeptide (TPR) repeat protein
MKFNQIFLATTFSVTALNCTEFGFYGQHLEAASKEAKDLVHQSIIEDPTNWMAHKAHTFLLIKQEKFDEAQKSFKRCYDLCDKSESSLISLIDVFVEASISLYEEPISSGRISFLETSGDHADDFLTKNPYRQIFWNNLVYKIYHESSSVIKKHHKTLQEITGATVIKSAILEYLLAVVYTTLNDLDEITLEEYQKLVKRRVVMPLSFVRNHKAIMNKTRNELPSTQTTEDYYRQCLLLCKKLEQKFNL